MKRDKSTLILLAAYLFLLIISQWLDNTTTALSNAYADVNDSTEVSSNTEQIDSTEIVYTTESTDEDLDSEKKDEAIDTVASDLSIDNKVDLEVSDDYSVYMYKSLNSDDVLNIVSKIENSSKYELVTSYKDAYTYVIFKSTSSIEE